PLLAFLLGPIFLRNLPCEWVADILLLPPGPDAYILFVLEQLGHLLMVPIPRGRPVVSGRLPPVQLARDPAHRALLNREPVKGSDHPGGGFLVDRVSHPRFGVTPFAALLTPRNRNRFVSKAVVADAETGQDGAFLSAEDVLAEFFDIALVQ